MNQEYKLNRKLITDAFSNALKSRIPSIKKGPSSYWTVDLNPNIYFYISFMFPKYTILEERTISMFYGIQNTFIKPSAAQLAQNMRDVTYSYRLHHQLFEFDNVQWHQRRVGYLYWRAILQRKKLQYYTDEQTQYGIDVLIPVAVDQIVKSYTKFYNKYHGTDSRLRDLRV